MSLNFSKSKQLLIYCVVFIAGVAIASFAPVELIQNDLWWFIGMAVCIVVLILFWRKQTIKSIGLIGLFLFLGIWRYAIGLPVNTTDKIWHYNGERITVVGKIVNEPDVRQKNVKYTIESIQRFGLQIGGRTSEQHNISGKILITTNLYPRYNYGDEIEIICELQAPEPFRGFAYDRYLARYGIHSICYYPEIKVIKTDQGNRLYKIIFSLKDKLRQIINFGLSEPEASLARAIILGDKKAVPDDLRDKFSQAGVSHIMAVSGMHISILAALAMGMLLAVGLWRKHAFYFAAGFLLIYIMLIGLPVSAMRAGLMGFLVLLALNLGRLNKLINSLVLTAVILLLIDPKLLRDDIGFQLSFLAVLGIIYLYPVFNRLAGKVKITKFSRRVSGLFSITMAAQIFTLPIIAVNFSQASLIAPLSNLLIIWILPVLIIAVLAAIVLSFFIPNFSFLFFLPAQLLLKYIIIIVELLVKVPYAYVEVGYFWQGWAILYYTIVILAVWRLTRNTSLEC